MAQSGSNYAMLLNMVRKFHSGAKPLSHITNPTLDRLVKSGPVADATEQKPK